MLLLAFPVTAFAAVKSTAATDAQITENVCSIWYANDGKETKLGDYNSIDLAMEALRELYVGPLADATIVDGNDEDKNLSNEIYAAAGSPVIKLNGNFQGAYARPNWATNDGENKIAYDRNKVVNIVIDGAKNENENYTMTYGTASKDWTESAFNHIAFYNLTIKNTNFVINRGASKTDNFFNWRGRDGEPGESFFVLDNCQITENATLSNTGEGSMFKVDGKVAPSNGSDTWAIDVANITFKDSTIDTKCGVGLQVCWGYDANIEVINSTLSLSGAAGLMTTTILFLSSTTAQI